MKASGGSSILPGAIKNEMKKIDIVIKMLKELQLCENEQRVITNIDDSNKILEIVAEEIEKR